MPFTLEVIRGSTTYNISAGQPIAIEEIDDLGGASVRNLEESGPYQDGSNHLGERLEPATMTLRLNVKGSTAAALDGYRDTLNAMFKPVRGVPITLKLTRDDGKVRQIDTYRTGRLTIPLVRQNRPGNLHRAVVQLRAPDPTWYDPNIENLSFAGPNAQWWTGYASIGTANVLEHVENPTAGQAHTWAGTIAQGSAWSVAFRSGSVPVAGASSGTVYAFDLMGSAYFRTVFGNYQAFGGFDGILGNLAIASPNLMTSGTHNYMISHQGGTLLFARDGTVIGSSTPGFANISDGFVGTASRWRSLHSNAGTLQWPVALPLAAIYNVALTETQRLSLNQHMNNGTAGSVFSSNVVYGGDFDTYPVITITGPIASPVITNTTTGETLDFSAGSVSAAEVWIIDTRYGRKSVLSGTISKLEYLSEDSDLSTFHIAPDPIATGGTNVIVLSGSSSGTATSIAMSYYNRYMSF